MTTATERFVTDDIVSICTTDLRPTASRVKGDGGGVKTTLTIVCDTLDALKAFAKRGATIAWQQQCHAAGVVPATATVMLSELAKRSGHSFKATPDSLSAKIKKMPEAEYRATLEKLGLPKGEIDKLARKQYPAK